MKTRTRVTDLQSARFQEKLNRLQRRVHAFQEIQGVYMPRATVSRATEDAESSGAAEPPYDTPLLLPSAFCRPSTPPLNTLDNVLLSIEARLRAARGEDTLGRLREHLLLRSRMYRIKDRQVRGQILSTRANTTLHTVNATILADALQYRTHYRALEAMDPFMATHTWKRNLKPLQDSDMRTLEESEESEGRRSLSWIWISQVDVSTEKGMQEGCLLSLLYFVLL